MRALARLLASLIFVAVVAQAAVLHHATGGHLFTQLPSDSLAKMQQAKPAQDPFAGLGMNDLSGEPAKVDNEFHFGLLPAGPGHGFADSASVLTFVGPALLLLILTLTCGTRRSAPAPTN